jgi:hypothetical protein
MKPTANPPGSISAANRRSIMWAMANEVDLLYAGGAHRTRSGGVAFPNGVGLELPFSP